MPENLANARLHWRKKNALRKAYFEDCDYLQAIGVLPSPPAVPFAAPRIRSLMYLGARMDTDNAMARHKWPLDYLQTRGYIVNDRALDWRTFPEQVVGRRDRYAIIITLTDL